MPSKKTAGDTNAKLDAILGKLGDLPTKHELEELSNLTASIEGRMTRLEDRMLHLEATAAREQLTTSKKLVEVSAKLDQQARVLRDHGDLLEGVATAVKGLDQERLAHQAAHDRFERRDTAFADKLGMNLRKLDAEA